MILKPPVVPSPSIGGAPKTLTTASRIVAAHSRFKALATSSAEMCGRSSKSFNITYSEPRFGAFVLSSNDCPEMPTVCPTPSVFKAIVSIWATISRVRCTDEESGSCTFTSKKPLSCCGTKPVGVWANS